MMKKYFLLPLLAALALIVSCEKPVTEAERNAQIEREVQQRLASERQAEEKDRLAQQAADLEAREQALRDQQTAATPQESSSSEETRSTTHTAERMDSRASSSDADAPRSYDTFYRKLEPYGAWRETADYGYVWQPREAQRSNDWRPYTNGRWAYTDAGWTWISNEPFGWAAYHYGRWTRLRGVGWVWVPGDEWAPAWVSWRTSEKNVGWAPLPPEARFERKSGIKKWADSYYDIDADEYVFIPNEDIGAQNIEQSVIPAERNYTIVNETTNVTNITYQNTTIVNEGPNYETLRGRSRQPIERLRINREYDIEQNERPRSSVSDSVLAIMAPMFTNKTTERPRNVGAPIPQGAGDRRGERANQPEAQRAREKMRSEATPPPDAPTKKYEKPAIVASTPTPAPTPVPTPALTPVQTKAVPTPMGTMTPAREVMPPKASPTATPRRERATPSPAPTAIATATPKPAPASTPVPTPKATSTPAPTATRVPTIAPTPASTPADAARASSGRADSPNEKATRPPRADRTERARIPAEPIKPKADEPAKPKPTPAAVPPKPAATPSASVAAKDAPEPVKELKEATPMLKERDRRQIQPPVISVSPAPASEEKAKPDREKREQKSGVTPAATASPNAPNDRR